MATTKENIHILGGGVIGLTTAVTLQQIGYSVNIVTQRDAQNTVSGVAAAIWFPYKAYPMKEVNEWSLYSYNKYLELEKDGNTGVSFIPFTIVEKETTAPSWLASLPKGLKPTKNKTRYNGVDSIAYTALFPLIETPLFIKYLQNQFMELGGKVQYETITSIEDLDPGITYINCLGLGAAKIFNDPDMYPIQGQIVKLEPNADIKGLSIEYPIDSFEDEHLYIIPRSDCIVVGGSSVNNNFSTVADEKRTQRILNRAYSIVPELKKLKILDSVVGLRPGRSRIKLSKDDNYNIFHNYGHGGAGYTVAWGCAEAIGALLEKA